MMHYAKHLFMVVLILLSSSSFALGASVSITSSGNGIFIIQGSQMDGVAGMDLNVVYDTPSLAAPSVTQGSLISGAMFAANTNNPGSIRIAVVSTKTFSSNGQIATISFASHTGTGKVTVTTSMIDANRAPVTGGGSSIAFDSQTPATETTTSTTTTTSTNTANTATTNTTTTGTTTGITAGTTGGSIQTSLGTISMPSDAPAKSDTKPADTTGVPAQTIAPAAPKQPEPQAEEKTVTEPAKPETVKITSYKGTLEYFRTYEGEKSPAILTALFNKKIAPAIRQEPAVALSDGKKTVKIVAEIKNAGNKSPNFALNGAKLVSLNKDDASLAWIVEALPQANSMQASLTILTASDIIEYPLTLAPPVESVSPDEADFAVFISDSGKAAPKRDLNGDGKHDYLDDYIYTANYLARKGTDKTGK